MFLLLPLSIPVNPGTRKIFRMFLFYSVDPSCPLPYLLAVAGRLITLADKALHTVAQHAFLAIRLTAYSHLGSPWSGRLCHIRPTTCVWDVRVGTCRPCSARLFDLFQLEVSQIIVPYLASDSHSLLSHPSSLITSCDANLDRSGVCMGFGWQPGR